MLNMLSHSVKTLIPTIRNFFVGQPIEKAWIFGSCSRGEERPDSDIDIMVRYVGKDSISILTISRISSQLGRLLNRRVDLVEDECILSLQKKVRTKIKILIYERKN